MTTIRETPQAFPPTRWSAVLVATQGAQPEAFAALDILCRAYWQPLYAYVRRCGKSPHDAQDLTQDFFRHLIEKQWLENADRARGRLRTFLITALKHLMANEWRRVSSQRRGGTLPHIQIDTTFAESRHAVMSLPADEAYDRQWAITLLDLTLERLRSEFIAAGNPLGFEILKTSLMAVRGEIDYGAMAGQLRSSEATVRVMVHRLRKRFREIYREEILQTLPDGADLEAELRHLAKALSAE